MATCMILPLPQHQATTEARDSSYREEKDGEEARHTVKCTLNEIPEFNVW